MNVGLVLVTYALYPEKLFRSVEQSSVNVRWYIHNHGPEQILEDQLSAYAINRSVNLVSHKSNRGLSRSWNDGVRQSMGDGNSRTLILNDDLHFVNDGLQKFVDFLNDKDDYGLCFLHGLDTGGGASGKVVQQGFACCCIGRRAIEEVGYFDQNFFPAYFEDNDYFYRVANKSLKLGTAGGILVEHERSWTTRNRTEIKQNNEKIFLANREYFIRKWGGAPEKERFSVPFNDSKYDLRISWEGRNDPYPEYRRVDEVPP